jgi:UDP-sugar pyrophosphorylase
LPRRRRTYAGGLKGYIANAKNLLAASAAGDNSFDGYTPDIPEGVSLGYGQSDFVRYEKAGVAAAAQAGFVLVAGGIGERLGYHGIKIGIPAELARGLCFLQLYIEHIRALQYLANLGKPRTQQV